MFAYGKKLAQESYDKNLVHLVQLNQCLYIPSVRQKSYAGLVENTWAQIKECLECHGTSLNAGKLFFKYLNVSNLCQKKA